jgi:hypothetical protein
MMKLEDGDVRAEYSNSLVRMGKYKGSAFGALAFGEMSIAMRVKSILNLKH